MQVIVFFFRKHGISFVYIVQKVYRIENDFFNIIIVVCISYANPWKQMLVITVVHIFCQNGFNFVC